MVVFDQPPVLCLVHFVQLRIAQKQQHERNAGDDKRKPCGQGCRDKVSRDPVGERAGARHGGSRPRPPGRRETQFRDGCGSRQCVSVRRGSGAFGSGCGGRARGAEHQQTLVEVRADQHLFTFWLRDVQDGCPIYMPSYRVAISAEHDDPRSFREIAEAVRAKGLVSQAQEIEAEPEETYEAACARNRNLSYCPTWLGLSRDMRIFRFGYTREAGSNTEASCVYLVRLVLLGSVARRRAWCRW